MHALKSLVSQFQLWIQRTWDNLLSRDLSFFKRLSIASIVSVVGFGVVDIIHHNTGLYSPPITFLAVTIIALFCGLNLSILFTVGLSLIIDFHITSSNGSVLQARASLEHFIVVCGIAIFIAALTSSLRASYQRTANAKQDAERAKQDAEKANMHKTEFLSKMSHEIRTPINGIIGMTNLTLKTNPNETQLHYLDSISNSANHLLSLVNDILDLSKIEAGKLQLESIAFNIEALLKEVTDTYAPIAQHRGLEFNSSFNSFGSQYFFGDPNRIRQVLINLIGNALKFTEKGSITLHAYVKDVIKGKTGDLLEIVFSVSDTGPGISKDIRNKLFMPFTQGDSSTSRTHGGSGLGLSICKQFVDLMNGSIEVVPRVDGKDGQGSTFRFTIKLQTASQLDIHKGMRFYDKDTSANHKSKRRAVNILLAEDNLINQEITRTILQSSGHTVDVADNGTAVLKAVENKHYDLILMDCQMPQMDGYEATERLRQKGVRIPIIALTASAFSEDRQRCQLVGMSDYLSKPFKEEVLMQMVDRYTSEWDASIQSAQENSEASTSTSSKKQNMALDLSYIHRLEELDRDSQTGLVNKLISIYLTTAPDAVMKIRNAITKKDTLQVTRLSHNFKSSNANLGLLRASEILERLEDANIDNTQSLTLLSSLETEVDMASKELQRYQRSEGT